MDLFDDEQVTTADKIDRPERALEKQAIDDFMKRNPQADGGRIGFLSGGDVERIVDIYNQTHKNLYQLINSSSGKPYMIFQIIQVI